MPFSENSSHETCLRNQEMIRQTAQAAGCTATEARNAYIRYYRSIVKSALENGLECGQALTALKELNALTPESRALPRGRSFALSAGPTPSL